MGDDQQKKRAANVFQNLADSCIMQVPNIILLRPVSAHMRPARYHQNTVETLSDYPPYNFEKATSVQMDVKENPGKDTKTPIKTNKQRGKFRSRKTRTL